MHAASGDFRSRGAHCVLAMHDRLEHFLKATDSPPSVHQDMNLHKSMSLSQMYR